jgi:hypothetical protein
MALVVLQFLNLCALDGIWKTSTWCHLCCQPFLCSKFCPSTIYIIGLRAASQNVGEFLCFMSIHPFVCPPGVQLRQIQLVLILVSSEVSHLDYEWLLVCHHTVCQWIISVFFCFFCLCLLLVSYLLCFVICAVSVFVIRKLGKLCNEELHDLHSSSSTVTVIKSRRMRRARRGDRI